MNRSRSSTARALGAIIGCTALVMTAAPPPGATASPQAQQAAKAAPIVVRANGTALRVVVGGQSYDSGTFRAVSTARRTTTSGTRKPAITLLDGQSVVNLGVLGQNAKNDIRDGRRGARACAGLAATGSTLVSIDRSTCLEPHGKQVQIDSGNLDLSDVEFVRSDAMAGLAELIETLGLPILLDVLAPIAEQALTTVLQAVGDPAIKLDFAAITGSCFANRQAAIGRARLDNARLYVQMGQEKVTLARLPVSPRPNTKVVVELDRVLNQVGEALRIQLTQGLTGILSPLVPAVQQLITALNTNLVTSLSEQLEPIEQNLLDIRLNNQQKLSKNGIRATSLSLRVLKAAAAVGGGDPFGLHIGSASCVAPARR